MSKTKVIVGLGSCGIAAGASKIYDKILALKNADLLDFELKKTSCVGMCFREPLVEVIDDNGSFTYGDVTEDKAVEIIQNHVLGLNPVKNYVVKTDLFEVPDNCIFFDQILTEKHFITSNNSSLTVKTRPAYGIL